MFQMGTQLLFPVTNNSRGISLRDSGQIFQNGTGLTDTLLSQRRNRDGDYITFFFNNTGPAIGSIRADGGAIAGPLTSDYRSKNSVVSLSNAVDVIKQLNPVSFEFNHAPGYTHTGFVAHELDEHVPEAVFGTKDATETIGTLTEWDGTELETDVAEPSAEELTYTEEVTDEEGVTTQEVRTKTWSATGTRDVYQGV